MILIGYFNLPSIDWSNVHPFQDYFEPSTQAFVNAFVSSGLSPWVTESTFIRSCNILDFVITSAIDWIGDVNIHCAFPHCAHCPIIFDYIFVFSHKLTPKNLSEQAWWKGKYGKIDGALKQ